LVDEIIIKRLAISRLKKSKKKPSFNDGFIKVKLHLQAQSLMEWEVDLWSRSLHDFLHSVGYYQPMHPETF
jgi:hypothetical protein